MPTGSKDKNRARDSFGLDRKVFYASGSFSKCTRTWLLRASVPCESWEYLYKERNKKGNQTKDALSYRKDAVSWFYYLFYITGEILNDFNFV